MKKSMNLYSCNFKTRKLFEDMLECFDLKDDKKDVVQLSISTEGKILSWTSPCGTGGCKNIARCKQRKEK